MARCLSSLNTLATNWIFSDNLQLALFTVQQEDNKMTSELIQNSIADAAKAHLLMYLIAGFHRAVLGHVSSVDICVLEHCHGGTQHVEYRGVHRHTLHLAASHHCCCAGALWVCCSFEDEVTSIVSPVPFSFQLILI